MKRIKLSNGEYALFDDCDYELVSQYYWMPKRSSRDTTCYAITQEIINGKDWTSMHRLIMNPDDGYVVDHINGNGLDNRRKNLRICTREENQRNCSLYKTNTSGYKGVYYVKKAKKKPYQASISYNNKLIYLGSFKNAIDAAKAYDEAAIKYSGEYAKTNKSMGLY